MGIMEVCMEGIQDAVSYGCTTAAEMDYQFLRRLAG